MAGRVWLCVWIAVSLMTAVVVGEGERAQDRDMHVEIDSVAFPLGPGDDRALVEEFQRRLRQYDAVRQRLDAGLPVQVVSSNAAVIIAIRDNKALRSERLTATQGDLFFPGIAALFRRLILDSLHGMAAEDFLMMITEDDAAPMAPACVNASYPDGGALTTMPSQLLQMLPRLPVGLEYRFIGRDLILWDPHAGLIIDFIPRVLSRADES
jgi:hypothetical protein